jgi:transcriptional regulator with XRE-family HTH domain
MQHIPICKNFFHYIAHAMTAKPHSKSATEPAEAINRHLGSRVKQLRAGRGWSLEGLAQASGVSRSMLSQIEREKANPTLAVTLRIARAFGLSLGELIAMPGAASSVTTIRAEDHAYDYRSDADCRIRTLSPLNLEKDVEFYEVRLRPGGALRSSPHFEGTREFLAVQKGSVRIESAEDQEDLKPGDSASYRAAVPHAILNTGKTDAAVYLIVVYR